MTPGKLAMLLAVIFMMAAGQILFKLAAGRIGPFSLTWRWLTELLINPYLICGALLYGLTTLLWVIVLSNSELSRSYLFVALTMIVVPLAGVVLFGEPITMGLVIGGALIVAGLAVVTYA